MFNQTSPVAVAPVPTSAEDEKKAMAVEMVNNYYKNFFGNDPTHSYNLISFKKTNGIMRNVMGQYVYEIDFEITIQTQRGGYKTGNGMVGYWQDFSLSPQKPDLYATGQQFLYDVKFVPVGTVLVFTGEITLESSDNGYQIKKRHISTVKDLGVRSVSNIAAQQTENGAAPAVSYTAPPVNLTNVLGRMIADEKNYIVKVKSIDVTDAATNANYVISKLVKFLANDKILDRTLEGLADTLKLVAKVNLSSRDYSTNTKLAFFTDAVVELSFLNTKTNQTSCFNSFKLTNFSLLATAYSSKQESENAFVNSELIPTIGIYLIGSFPITGSITEITERNSKKDEAKLVKINIGRNQGLMDNFELYLPDVGRTKNFDLIIKELYPDYAICKVKNNSKTIATTVDMGKIVKVKTYYLPTDK
ncbi:hypothetical protein [Mucilaginibacter sp. OK283]|uniref:hypothetical protein n=1 Tax=Mucilaginibacter sp. OK283 TaxID=1881049 RepID=UPI00115F82D4|nr:hypothetical protein [Mucilaginibacter sp. OK283]